MKTYLLTFIPATAAFYLEPVLQTSTRLRMASSIPQEDGIAGVDKMSFPRQDFSSKGPDLERAKVRWILLLFGSLLQIVDLLRDSSRWLRTIWFTWVWPIL